MRVLLIFFTSLCFSQNISVTYNLKILEDENLLKNDIIRESYLQTIQGANKLQFVLFINDSISKFSFLPMMDLEEDNATKSAISFSGVKKPIFTYKNSVFRNNPEGVYEENEFLIVEPFMKDWKFQNETKSIDGYTCYKATTEYIVKNPKGEFHHPVIAWFCPEIPISMGPKGYGGLPGLILELQEWNSVFGMKSISFNKENELLQLPSKGQRISNEDYQNLIAEAVKKHFDEK